MRPRLISIMRKAYTNFSAFAFLLASSLFGPVASASVFGRMDNVAKTGGYAAADEFTMSKLIGQAVSTFLGLLGVIFVVLIVFAGYNWMTAAGDSGKVDKAKETLWRAIIGLIITVGAYAIWWWVFMNFV